MGVQMDGLTMDEWMDGWINSWMEEKEIRNVDAKNKRNKATLEIERQSGGPVGRIILLQG